jgi:hypothetical protein
MNQWFEDLLNQAGGAAYWGEQVGDAREELRRIMARGSSEDLERLENMVLNQLPRKDSLFSFQVWSMNLFWPVILNVLWSAGRITDTLLNAFLAPETTAFRTLMWARFYKNQPNNKIGYGSLDYMSAKLEPELVKRLDQFLIERAWQAAERFQDRTDWMLVAHTPSLAGSRFVLRALQLIETRKIKKLPPLSIHAFANDLTPERAIVEMAQAKLDDLDTPEKQAAFTDALKTVQRATLELILPYATDAYDFILTLLGWKNALPLVQLFDDMTENFLTNPSKDDPFKFDVPAAKQALTAAGAEADKILKWLSVTGKEERDVALLLRALLGTNRQDIEKKLRQKSHAAIIALGLLPLAKDETILSRYLRLKEIAKDAKELGVQRRRNALNLVNSALNNLAQVGGYETRGRLELAMEAQIADELALPGREWTSGDYTITLETDGTDARLIVTRAGKSLKSIPKAVRDTQAYADARESVEALREQVRRIRDEVLERLIASGDLLQPDELAALMRLPAGAGLLTRMIFRRADGIMGMLDGDARTLCDVNGASFPIDRPLGVAHPFDFYEAGTLAAWQRKIVAQKIAQPVKQAFREVYLLTPAERNTGTFSNRFAGHTLNAGVAMRLLQGRDWRYGYGYLEKPVGAFKAIFTIVYNGYPGSGQPLVTDQVKFISPTASKNRYGVYADNDFAALETVPPLIFSEVMRDVDFAVSIAQSDGDEKLSPEAYTSRAEIVRTLVDDLGLQGVEIDDHHVYVQGKRARYKIHLGSATIHIVPGGYLCIVPQRTYAARQEQVFLPFSGTGDAKMSEVISKILLLSADDKITDPSILQQIRRQV